MPWIHRSGAELGFRFYKLFFFSFTFGFLSFGFFFKEGERVERDEKSGKALTLRLGEKNYILYESKTEIPPNAHGSL